MLDAIETVLDVKKDIKRFLELAEGTNLKEMTKLLKALNKKFNQVDFSDLLKELRRLNTNLEILNPALLRKVAKALDTVDLVEVQRDINEILGFISTFSEKTKVEKGTK